jgi:RimJ/RimL family protein N-acetyltransferase
MTAVGATDPAQYDQAATLKNGTPVRVRAVRPDDKERLSEAFRNLEKESIYTRFFYHKRELSADELKSATEIDFQSVVALVVTIEEGDREVIIGGGRFAVIDPTAAQRSAEVAFTVEEDYHGQGMAGLLLRHLIGIARQSGVAQFEAEVLAGNRGMLKVFEKSGLPMQASAGGGVVHVSMSLKAEGAPAPPM